MNWNDNTYTEIVAKHPVLGSKTESVALAVWALTQNKDMTPQNWRDLSTKTGVKVAGRAVGSAREILGHRAARPPRKKKDARASGRPKGSRNRRSQSTPGDAVETLVSSLKEIQRERDEAVKVLERVRSLLGGLG